MLDLETTMTDKDGLPGPLGHDQDVTTDLVRLMPRDLIFTMRFLGESQHRLQRHFQDFIETEMGSAGMTPQTHPMIHSFIERHAVMLRDFVFSGVSLSRQFHVDEIERLLGDTTSLLRVDIWDDLETYIAAAEAQFRSQVPVLPNLLSDWESPEQDGR